MNARPFCLPAGVVSGIYHLVDADGGVIYVGQTENVYIRLASNPLRRIAAEVRFFPAPINDLNELEAAHIREHAPHYNRAGLTTQFIPILKRRRGVYFDGGWYASATEFLDARDPIGVAELRALDLLKSGRELPELLATGFPEPAFSMRNGRWPRWRGGDVLRFLNRAREAA
jgi:hypothetical protein